MANTSVVLRDSGGAFVIAHTYERGRILVFDSGGQFIRAVGRRGRGPGEYLTVIAFANKGDTLLAFDRDMRRCTVLDSSLEVARSFVMDVVPGPASGVAVLSDGRFVVAKHLPTRTSAGYPLQLFSVEGSHVTAFGDESPEFDAGRAFLSERRITADHRDNIWSAGIFEYRLERWDPVRGLNRTLSRHVPWFEPWREERLLSPDSPPLPEITAIRFNPANGLLYVIVRVVGADGDWSSGLMSEMGPDGRLYYGPEDFNKVYDSILEVIEPESGRLVASTRTPMSLNNFADADHVISYRENAEGVGGLDVWRITVRVE